MVVIEDLIITLINDEQLAKTDSSMEWTEIGISIFRNDEQSLKALLLISSTLCGISNSVNDV